MHHFILAPATVLAASILATTPSLAQDIPDPQTADAGPDEELETGASTITISGSVDLVSDYRFRGVSFSDEDIAIQGSINVAHSSGFYVGTWASSLEDSELYGHTEVDLYAGWTGEVAPGLSVDGGLLYYLYPNGNDAVGDSDYFEPYASISTALGPVSATVGAAYAFEQGTALPSDNIYLYSDLGAGIPGTPVSLSAHLGYSDGSLDYGSGGYLDWSLGASVAYRSVIFGIAYVDTDLPGIAGQDATALFSVSAGF